MSLTSFQLKCIAIVAMTLDHTGLLLFPEALWMRCVGRLAFPIFSFLLAEGFYHTHDIKRYLLRLWSFALISEIPYDLAFHGTLLEFESQNVFFTLGISLVLLELLGRIREPSGQVVVLVCGMWLGERAGVDYGFLGVLLPVIYGRFRETFFGQLFIGALWNFLWLPGVQYLGVLATVPLALYNGKQGRRMKYFFYLFYPIHLLILYGICMCL